MYIRYVFDMLYVMIVFLVSVLHHVVGVCVFGGWLNWPHLAQLETCYNFVWGSSKDTGSSGVQKSGLLQRFYDMKMVLSEHAGAP